MSYRQSSFSTERFMGAPVRPASNSTTQKTLNMMDCEAYEVDLFKELYYLRWGIEENYKRLKQWVEIENFSLTSLYQGMF
jgi:IS4 transposase